jgi:hypothetical protein
VKCVQMELYLAGSVCVCVYMCMCGYVCVNVCMCVYVRMYVCLCVYVYTCIHVCMYSGPSSYDRPDIRTNWVTTKILVLTYDQSLELRPECRSRPKRVSACAVVNKEPEMRS